MKIKGDKKFGSTGDLALEIESSQLDHIMEQKTFCSTCRNESDMEDKFCPKCGNSLLEIVQNENARSA